MSLSELIQSSRGPGVIGTILALAIVLGFGYFSIIALDKNIWAGDLSPEAILREQGREIDSLRHHIQEGQIRIKASEKLKRGFSELERFKSNNQSQKSRIFLLDETLKNADAAFKKQLDSFEFYKNSYRSYVRGNAKGASLVELKVKNGAIYKNVIIREVTAVGLQIVHDEGLKRIPFEELPDDMIDFYQFDPKQKTDALEAERLAHSQNEASAITAREQALKEKNSKREQDSLQKKMDEVQTHALYASKIRSIEGEIRQLQLELSRSNYEDASAKAKGRIRVSGSGIILEKIQGEKDQIKSLQIFLSKIPQGNQ